MESTGKYWIPVFNILESDCTVFVANPKYVKGIRGKKTDKKDSIWLCDLHKHGSVGTLTKPQAEKMMVCLAHLENIDNHKSVIESAVLELIDPFREQIDLILTLPGVKDIYTANAIIGEIGVDMSVFLSSRHLCSWAGLTPQNNESAGKKKSTRVSRAGVFIKPLLIQCANAAIKSKDCPYFRVRFEQISRRRGKKKAVVAIAHMLLNCIFHMLSRNESFNHELYRIDNAVNRDCSLSLRRNKPSFCFKALVLKSSCLLLFD